MAVYNRVPLPADEHARIETSQDKILKALKWGTQTNKSLSRIALDYGRPIRALRKKGHTIHCSTITKGKGGLREYTLMSQPDPEWVVEAEVKLADGRIFIQSITLRAQDSSHARNGAQHLFSTVKLLSATKVVPKPSQSRQSSQPRQSQRVRV